MGQVATWFGDVTNFAHIDLLVKMIVHGVPVEVGGVGDLDAALPYGKYRSIGPYEENIISAIADDVRLGRVFVFRGKRQTASPVCACHLWVSRFPPRRSEMSTT